MARHAGAAHSTDASSPGGPGVRDKVLRVLELIRPAIQSDGGDIELVDITPSGVVRIRFQGACIGCPSSAMTLKMGIEKNLRDNIPEITGVESVGA
ncbi:MAG: NifU family protein [Phycisphaerales bacterium]|nr:NifU family protein [Phycisphaerales bacterium]